MKNTNPLAVRFAANIRAAADAQISRASANSQADVSQLISARVRDNELQMVRSLKSQTFGHVWHHTVRDTMAARGHIVRNEDCATHDTVECGQRQEYKAANFHCDPSGTLRINVTNEHGSARWVKASLLVFDTTSTRIADGSVYWFGLPEIRQFGFQTRYGGWGLNLSAAKLFDRHGFGQYRYSFDEYLTMREEVCRCRV